MADVAIRIDSISKMFVLGERQASYQTLRETVMQGLAQAVRGLGRPFQGRHQQSPSERAVWALKDVSLEIQRGEAVGLVGRNGAGKSTLLKILSRITPPTSGVAEIRGRIGSLLEVGTGFHQELTGRENIYLNGSILGMRRAEIDRKFDEIVAFSEIETFIDTPVKHYSSGMYLRLAFSVAAHLEPEILLVDEVLAVGDASFQKKCLGKMNDVTGQGRTILFVSHNMAAISALCPRAVFLDRGRVIAHDETSEVVSAYLRTVEHVSTMRLDERADRRGSQALRLVEFEFQDSSGEKIAMAYSGQTVVLAIRYVGKDKRPPGRVLLNIRVLGQFGEPLFQLDSSAAPGLPTELPAQGVISCIIPRLPLKPGRYSFSVVARVTGMVADEVEHAGVLQVDAGDFFKSGKLPLGSGPLLVDHSWDVASE